MKEDKTAKQDAKAVRAMLAAHKKRNLEAWLDAYRSLGAAGERRLTLSQREKLSPGMVWVTSIMHADAYGKHGHC